MYVCVCLFDHVSHCTACPCLCAVLIEQPLCVTAVMFIRVVRSGMITIWVARFGLEVAGRGLVSRAPPAMHYEACNE